MIEAFKRAAPAALVAAALATGGTGCVSIATYERQMAKCRQLVAEASQLGARLESEREEKERLRASVEEKDEAMKGLRSTYEELIDALKEDIASGAVAVKNEGDELTITVGNTILFRSGRAELQPAGLRTLQKIADVVGKVSDRLVQVGGHTDAVPISGALKARFPSNWELSAARAASVVRNLEDKGVPPQNLVLAAYGPTRPVAGNDTADGRRLNRRVEISLIPKAAPATP